MITEHLSWDRTVPGFSSCWGQMWIILSGTPRVSTQEFIVLMTWSGTSVLLSKCPLQMPSLSPWMGWRGPAHRIGAGAGAGAPLGSVHPPLTLLTCYSTDYGPHTVSSEPLVSSFLLSFELVRKYPQTLMISFFRRGCPGKVLRPLMTQLMRCDTSGDTLTLSLQPMSPLRSSTCHSNWPSQPHLLYMAASLVSPSWHLGNLNPLRAWVVSEPCLGLDWSSFPQPSSKLGEPGCPFWFPPAWLCGSQQLVTGRTQGHCCQHS